MFLYSVNMVDKVKSNIQTTIKKQMNSMKTRVRQSFRLVLALAAMLTMGQTAMAATVTYTVSGGTGKMPPAPSTASPSAATRHSTPAAAYMSIIAAHAR